MHVGQRSRWWSHATLADAQDAGEAGALDYDTLQSVTEVEAAVRTGRPVLWDDAPGNVALDGGVWPRWMPAAGDRAPPEEAPQVAPRAPGQPAHRRVGLLETRGENGEIRSETKRQLRAAIRRPGDAGPDGGVMGLPKAQLRVVADDIGGAVG